MKIVENQIVRKTVVMIMFILGVSIYGGAQSFVADGFKYRVMSVQKNEAMICGLADGVETPTSITVPYTVPFNGRTFTIISIGDSAFMNLPVSSVTLQDSIKTIGKEAFAGCSKLTTIVLPGQLTTIADGTFRECRSLAKVDARLAKITGVGKYAFLNCENLVDFQQPSSASAMIVEVGVSAFKNCTSLREIEFGNSNSVSVNDSSFYNTKSLKQIKTNLKQNSSAGTILVGSSAFEYSGLTGELRIKFYDIRERAFAHTGITSIQSEAYYNYFDLPFLWEESFAFCENLETVDVKKLRGIGTNAFEGCNKLRSLTISSSHSVDYCCANLPALEEVNLIDVYHYELGGHGEYPSNKISKGMFMNCTSLKKVTLGSLYQDIGASAFEGCTSLSKIVTDGTWYSIEERAFYGCSSLKNFQWTTDRYWVDEEAFANSGVHSIAIGKGGCWISNPFTPLNTIYVRPSTPPNVTFNLPDEVYINAVVIVPEGSLAQYQSTSPWDKFWNIKEGDIPSTGIEGVGEDTPVAGPEMWYDLHGRRIDPSSATPGLYIRRIGSSTSKVLLK